MSKEMLINASEPGNIRVAILDRGRLDAYFEEYDEEAQSRGNIYLGRIANVEASLDACFVEYGEAKHGFLPFGEILGEAVDGKPGEGKAIHHRLRRGQLLVVQVDKEPIGTKGARLTTNISIAGRYMVLMPHSETVGVSRKIEDPEARKAYRDLAAQINPPKGMGIIVRTAGLGQGKRDLSRDLSYLLRLWKDIQGKAASAKQPLLLHAEAELILRVLRDYYTSDITRTWIDEPQAFEKAQEFFKLAMPRQKSTLQAYSDREPIFDRFGVERQLELIHGRSVPLPSGGSLVIDSTEALVAIDVNSGKTKAKGGQEATAYETNLEAAAEVARQLRLRDLGGIVVIDFIDMDKAARRTAVDKALRDAMKADKARHQLGKISAFGLCTLTRQRLGRALARTGSIPCPTCGGGGRVRDQESVALRVLRRIRAEASGGGVGAVRVRLHPSLAEHVQNRHRADLLAVERQLGILITLQANPALAWGQEEVERTAREGGARPAPRPERPAPERPAPRPERPAPERPAPRPDREERPAPPAPEAARGSSPARPDAPASGQESAPAEASGRSRRRRRRRRKHPEGSGPAPAQDGEPGAPAPTPEDRPPQAQGEPALPAPADPADEDDGDEPGEEINGNLIPPDPEDGPDGNLVPEEPEIDGNTTRPAGDRSKRRRRRRRRRPSGGRAGTGGEKIG